MANPIVHIDFLGPDRKRRADWFAGVFEWTLAPVDEMNYTMFHTGPTSGGGFLDDGIGTVGVVPYVAVTDIHATLQQAVDAGAEVLMPVQTNAYVTVAMFRDPFGITIGLVLDERSAAGATE